FFQAEDGIRYRNVTGVQTCALPICGHGPAEDRRDVQHIAPMKDSAIAAIKGNVLHIPTVLGGDVPTYNLPDVKETLRFTPDVLEIGRASCRATSEPVSCAVT